MKEMTEKEILNKAAAYCATAERCCSEVSCKLSAWEVPENMKPRVMEWLLKQKYVDESRYCRSYIHDKFHFNRWGRLKITQMLRYKGIAQEVIGEQLLQIDDTEYRKTLTELVRAKKGGVKARSSYELSGKLIRFALGRGFEMAEIRRVLEHMDDVEMD